MSIFNQMIRGGAECEPTYPQTSNKEPYKLRTFKETLGDQILYHKRKVAELEAVHKALTPELETFVEALQKLG